LKTPDYPARLGKLLDRVSVSHADAVQNRWSDPILDAQEPVLNEFLRSFLIWEAGVPAARAAAKRIAEHLVDFNDLRVCLPDDLSGLLGGHYPLAAERSQRLRAALADLCRRTHSVSMEHVVGMAKREAKAYVESLEGVPDFVAARLSLVSFEVHAMPMDSRTLARLVEAGAMPEDAAPDDAADQIQRRVKAGDLLGAYLGLQAWADEQCDADGSARRSRGKS
jgi:hypothetical protein